MSQPWELCLFDENQELKRQTLLTGSAEVGRCDEKLGERNPPYYVHKPPGSERWRVVIAAREEYYGHSRRHLLIEPLEGGRMRLTNQSERYKIDLDDGREVIAGASLETALPAAVRIGRKLIRLQNPDLGSLSIAKLDEVTEPPGSHPSVSIGRSRWSNLASTTSGQVDLAEAVKWFRAAQDMVLGAAFSSDFFQRAAQAVAELVDLDLGQVLLLHDEQWRVHAQYSARTLTADHERMASQTILQLLLTEKRTLFQVPTESAATSLAGLKAVVAAPILGRDNDVVGALYGERRLGGAAEQSGPISKPQALLVELLACGVAAGLARFAQEQAAAHVHGRFEQFFGQELAQQLLAKPELMQGENRVVSILICDIRRFSHISERLGPTQTVAWINKAMEAFSQCVLAEAGVVVNFTGDELLAMWGAPWNQPDHAARACRAALAILDTLPVLNQQWQPILGEPTAVGIGVNSGVACVGNIGAQCMFKYGPLGDTVNVASRVQGATRYLRTPVLVTRETRDLLGAEFACRRLCQVKVVNIVKPVELFELVSAASLGRAELHPRYEEALLEFEARRFQGSIQLLGNLLPLHADDGPSLVLLARAVACLTGETPALHPVWELAGK